MKICYISDFLLSDIIGGGELNDYELCSIISESIPVTKKRCRELTQADIEQHTHFIISNFVTLSPTFIDYITKNCKYIIYEHDHKYLANRNPCKFKNFKAPPSAIVHEQFYNSAIAVFCQSGFHQKIINKNIPEENVHNVSGNLWSLESLGIMRTLLQKEKKQAYSILNSRTAHKNTRAALAYCEEKGYKSELVSSNNYQEFLSLISNNQSFIFMPKTPETLSRVVVECKMMGMKILINKNVGASYEPWFALKGAELIDYIASKRQTIPNLVIKMLKYAA